MGMLSEAETSSDSMTLPARVITHDYYLKKKKKSYNPRWSIHLKYTTVKSIMQNICLLRITAEGALNNILFFILMCFTHFLHHFLMYTAIL